MRSKPATQYIAWRNRMRTQHPNLWHPIRFAIMLIVLAWTIYGVCYEPPTDIFGVIWVAMLVTALVPSPLFLKSTSVAILVIASIGDLFTPYAHLGNSLPAQLYAYGMLAYSTNAIIVATLLTYYVVNILLIDPPGPNTNPVAMVSMYAMVLLLGQALSWSEKTTQKSRKIDWDSPVMHFPPSPANFFINHFHTLFFCATQNGAAFSDSSALLLHLYKEFYIVTDKP